MLVFDINWNATEDLYRGKGSLPSRVLYQALEWRQAKCFPNYHVREELIEESGAEKIFKVLQPMPAGWFISLGRLTMPYLALKAGRVHEKFLGSQVGIAVFTSPHYVPLLKALRPKTSIYHPVDDYTYYWPRRAKLTSAREIEIVELVDLVVCAGHFKAKSLRNQFPERRKDIHHLCNPVPEGFVSDQPTTSLYLSGNRERAVLGYIGGMSGRVDVNALYLLANRLKEADMHIYGTDTGGRELLADLPNIKFFEPVSRSEIPAVIQDFDVCLLPQSKSQFNHCCSPRKLYEYLGSGRPIVTLETPESETLAPFVYSTYSPERFVESVAHLLKDGEPSEYPSRRVELAQSRTPDALCAKLAGFISNYRDSNQARGIS